MLDSHELELERWGLRFSQAAVEGDYRRWRVVQVLPTIRIAVLASVAGWAGAVVGFYLGAPSVFPRAATWIVCTAVPVLLAILVFTYVRRLWPLATPMAVIGNLIAGFLNVFLGIELLHSYSLAAGAAAMTIFTGLAIFRLSPLNGILGNVPYVLWCGSLMFAAYRAGLVGPVESVWCVTLLLIALMMGLMVCTAQERTTRETFRNERIIGRQRQALLEERANLSRFLSPEVTQMVREQGIEATLIQQTLMLSAVCCDLRGFTVYTETHGAQQMATVLREYYDTVVDVARRYGGTVKDFAGDGALVLVGAPLPRPDHAQAGMALARELVTAVAALTTRFSTPTAVLGIGAGIATGACAVGAIGSQNRLEYTAIGSAVNLASRLCARATHRQILICPDTAKRVSPSASWFEEPIQVKGFDQPLRVTIESV